MEESLEVERGRVKTLPAGDIIEEVSDWENLRAPVAVGAGAGSVGDVGQLLSSGGNAAWVDGQESIGLETTDEPIEVPESFL
jgi:hypothetical protein